jgi:hypothetical protein
MKAEKKSRIVENEVLTNLTLEYNLKNKTDIDKPYYFKHN